MAAQVSSSGVTSNADTQIHSGVPTHDEQKDNAAASALAALMSKSHLERDRCLRQFQTLLPTLDAAELSAAKEKLLDYLSSSNPWESIHGAAMASEAVLKLPGQVDSDSFIPSVQDRCVKLITHHEARVRESVSSLIGVLASVDGRSTWDVILPVLRANAADNFSLDEKQRLAEASQIAERDLDVSAAKSKKAHQLLHETEGWRGLETTLLAMARLSHGCASTYLMRLASADETGNTSDSNLRNLINCVSRARPHPNRFVREAGLKLFDGLMNASIQAVKEMENCEDKTGSTKAQGLLERIVQDGLCTLQAGLQDNWSQVRFAASVATRTVLLGVSAETRHELYPLLLARMCLNRHYVAEGVRNYSQTTWRTVVGSEGRVWLTQLLDEVVTFYDSQTEADNHAVREAACQSLGEAALKLDRSQIEPVVGRIVGGLLRCFKDESWPVRDHACRALADVVERFPKEVEKEGVLEEMFKLFRRHLSDNIPSVRENCAGGLVRASMGFEDTHPVMGLVRVKEVSQQQMEGIKEQKERSVETMTVKDTQYGASTKLAQSKSCEEDEAHTNQVMYSCGSLAPKLRRGGGCMDHGFVRAQEGWEVAHGGLLLFQEMISNEGCGHSMSEGGLKNVVRCGVVGMEKEFRSRTRFMECVLVALKVGMEKGKSVDEEDLVEVMKMIAVGRRGGDSCKQVGSQVRRLLCRQFGLGEVGRVEKQAGCLASIAEQAI